MYRKICIKRNRQDSLDTAFAAGTTSLSTINIISDTSMKEIIIGIEANVCAGNAAGNDGELCQSDFDGEDNLFKHNLVSPERSVTTMNADDVCAPVLDPCFSLNSNSDNVMPVPNVVNNIITDTIRLHMHSYNYLSSSNDDDIQASASIDSISIDNLILTQDDAAKLTIMMNCHNLFSSSTEITHQCINHLLDLEISKMVKLAQTQSEVVHVLPAKILTNQIAVHNKAIQTDLEHIFNSNLASELHDKAVQRDLEHCFNGSATNTVHVSSSFNEQIVNAIATKRKKVRQNTVLKKMKKTMQKSVLSKELHANVQLQCKSGAACLNLKQSGQKMAHIVSCSLSPDNSETVKNKIKERFDNLPVSELSNEIFEMVEGLQDCEPIRNCDSLSECYQTNGEYSQVDVPGADKLAGTNQGPVQLPNEEPSIIQLTDEFNSTVLASTVTVSDTEVNAIHLVETENVKNEFCEDAVSALMVPAQHHEEKSEELTTSVSPELRAIEINQQVELSQNDSEDILSLCAEDDAEYLFEVGDHLEEDDLRKLLNNSKKYPLQVPSENSADTLHGLLPPPNPTIVQMKQFLSSPSSFPSAGVRSSSVESCSCSPSKFKRQSGGFASQDMHSECNILVLGDLSSRLHIIAMLPNSEGRSIQLMSIVKLLTHQSVLSFVVNTFEKILISMNAINASSGPLNVKMNATLAQLCMSLIFQCHSLGDDASCVSLLILMFSVGFTVTDQMPLQFHPLTRKEKIAMLVIEILTPSNMFVSLQCIANIVIDLHKEEWSNLHSHILQRLVILNKVLYKWLKSSTSTDVDTLVNLGQILKKLLLWFSGDFGVLQQQYFKALCLGDYIIIALNHARKSGSNGLLQDMNHIMQEAEELQIFSSTKTQMPLSIPHEILVNPVKGCTHFKIPLLPLPSIWLPRNPSCPGMPSHIYCSSTEVRQSDGFLGESFQNQGSFSKARQKFQSSSNIKSRH